MKIFTSRTVWTVIAITILNGFPSVRNMLPMASLPYVDVVLGLLAVYFRANPQAQL